MPNAVLEAVAAWADELTAIRRDIHAHPELGREEHRTAALVAAKLREWGVDVTEGVGRLGVVGTITGTHPGQRAIGLRADMDALQIEEATGLPWASTRPGVMHACGHDGHTTMLLGAARWLSQNRDFAGTVHLIFQPAEEGRGGARAMLEDGLFTRFPAMPSMACTTSRPFRPAPSPPARDPRLPPPTASPSPSAAPAGMADPHRILRPTSRSCRRISCSRCRRSSGGTFRHLRRPCSRSARSMAARPSCRT